MFYLSLPNIIITMFYHIVCVADNNIIGYNGSLPWKYRSKSRWYDGIVGRHRIVVGRKAYEADEALATKENVVVVSRKLPLRDVLTETQDEDKVFIIGGESIYQQTMDIVKGIWIARLHIKAAGDKFYPGIPEDMNYRYSYVMPEDKWHCFVDTEIHCYTREWKFERPRLLEGVS